MFKKTINPKHKTIVISRTDSIGDVMLTLPICAYLKQEYEGVKIIFLGKAYTKAIIDSCKSIDAFYDWDEIKNQNSLKQKEIFQEIKAHIIIHVFPNKEIAKLAKAVKIKYRIGTSHRIFHLLTCNFRPSFTRKNSKLHEAQLNFKLLKPFNNTPIPTLTKLDKRTDILEIADVHLPEFLENSLEKESKLKVILHPKSQGSAVEWPINKYMELAEMLAKEGCIVYFTGTESEGAQFRHLIPKNEHIIDTSGMFSLQQLQNFINRCDALVACSTGPLHIAGFLSKITVGVYSPRIPIHPGRWRPLGKNVRIVVNNQECVNCKKRIQCDCIEQIEVEAIARELLNK